LWLEELPRASRKVLPWSGVVLIAIAALGVLPEVAQSYGWLRATLWVALGFAALWLINRYVHPVCPSCSHSHDHDACDTRLHGFAAPLIVASSVHSFMDGWSMLASQQQGSEKLRFVFLLAIALHKVPEGLALGAILRSAMRTAWKAAVSSVGAQSMTVAGALVASALAPHLGTQWIGPFLGIAGGSFIYLGYHAIEAEWKRRGVAARQAASFERG
jgi:zinc transporter ZupT